MRTRMAAVAFALAAACTASAPGDQTTPKATGSASTPVAAGVQWFGEITTSATYEAGTTTCTERWDVDMELRVAGSQVAGDGDANLLRSTGCGGTAEGIDFAQPETILRFDVRGRRTPKRFALELVQTGPEGFTGLLSYGLFSSEGSRVLAVPTTSRTVAQGRATVESDTPDGGAVAADHRVLLVCNQC